MSAIVTNEGLLWEVFRADNNVSRVETMVSLVTTGAPRADGINQKSAAELGPFGVKKIVFNLGLVKLERMHIS